MVWNLFTKSNDMDVHDESSSLPHISSKSAYNCMNQIKNATQFLSTNFIKLNESTCEVE